MSRRNLGQAAAYVIVGLLSVGAAFFISIQLLGRSHAQESAPESNAPPSAEAPTTEASPEDEVGVVPDGQSGGASELEGFLEPFIYDIVNRRDPFQPYADYVPSDGPGNNGRPLTHAQRYDLDQLRLIAIMWDVKDPKAMFVDPESEVLVVGRDDGIGNRSGYIAAIREGEVVVVEALRTRGDIIYKKRVRRLER